MLSFRLSLPSFRIIPLLSGVTGFLAVAYIALIAMVVGYAALTVEFSQSVKNDEAALATLESQYLAKLATIEGTNPVTDGYHAPLARIFVPAQTMTALR